jgi:serine protease Do
MKHRIQILMSAALLLTGVAALGAAQATKSESRSESREVRTNAGPERERRFMLQRGEKPEMEMETVAFLGVETGPVSAAVSTQLGLPRGTGLVVNHLVPNSPAAGVLNVHDILLKLDDQILIETRQLSVLIRNKKEGDEVTLTYLRGGKQATAKVKLGKHEAPKFSFEFAPGPGAFAFAPGGERFEQFVPSPEGDREEADRLLSLLPRSPGAPDGPPGFVPRAPRVRIDRIPGPGGVRAMSVNTRNSNIVYSDDDGSLDLRINEGVKTLVAKNAKGEELFSGPVTTPEERQALPAAVRERLERLEHMNGVTFNTDGDFHGGGTKVVRPRGIAFPLPTATPQVVPLRRAPASF